MRTQLVPLLALLAAGAAPAGAQVHAGLRVGVLAASDLVRDSIVQAITVRQNVAATVGFSLQTPVDARSLFGAGVAVGRSNLVRRSGTERVRLAELTTWWPHLVYTRTLGAAFDVAVTAGAIVYRPDRTAATPFREDKPIRGALGVGLRWKRAVSGDVGLVLDLSYDAHRFTTRALRAEGFTGERLVHRVSLGASVTQQYGRPDR